MNKRFSDKTVLITGAGGGIGLEVVKLMSNEGATIIAADFEESRLKATTEIAQQSGPEIDLLPGD